MKLHKTEHRHIDDVQITFSIFETKEHFGLNFKMEDDSLEATADLMKHNIKDVKDNDLESARNYLIEKFDELVDKSMEKMPELVAEFKKSSRKNVDDYKEAQEMINDPMKMLTSENEKAKLLALKKISESW